LVIVVVKRGAKISRKGSTLCVSRPIAVNEEKSNSSMKYRFVAESVPLIDIEMLVIVGSNVRLSSGAILMLAEANVPVIVHSRERDVVLLTPYNVKIAEVRRRLYKLADSVEWRVHIGKSFIEGKLLGFANVIRYLAYKDAEKGKDSRWVLEEIDNINNLRKSDIFSIRSIEDLRLYEAKWSKKLWELASTFIPSKYGFTGRDPKSRDPINSAVSYSYAIIYGLCTHALIAAGLDPYVGIIHSERAGRTSLVYDFSEMFKPIAIHAVAVASRATTLGVDGSGYLTKSSLEAVTRHLYRLLRRKHHKWRYTARGEVYAKAWELRQNVEKGTKFEPFIYTIK